MNLSGIVWPYVGFRRLPCNRDGSLVDSGEDDLLDEIAPFFLRVLVFEWLGFGVPLWPFAIVRDARTGQPVADGMDRLPDDDERRDADG